MMMLNIDVLSDIPGYHGLRSQCQIGLVGWVQRETHSRQQLLRVLSNNKNFNSSIHFRVGISLGGFICLSPRHDDDLIFQETSLLKT